VQADDALSLEFSAPRAIYGRFERGNVDRLRAVALRAEQPPAILRLRASATALEWRHRAEMELTADAPDLAYQDFLEALEIAPDNAELLAGYVRAAAAAGRLDDADAYLRARAARADAVAIQVELSRVLAARGETKAAAVAAQHGAALDPSNERALGQLVSILADDGNEPALEQLAGILRHSAPDRPVTMYCEMRLSHLKGDFAQAASFGERLTSSAADEENAARNLNLLGITYAALGDHDRARRAFEASLRIVPRAPAVLVNLGTTELRSSRPAEAAERFAEALFLYPTLAPALEGMAQALERQGNARRAAAIRAVRTGR
jgi:tetratricopeptide (TPR) repeat protein